MPTAVNLTGNIADLIGTDFDARRTKAWVTANTEVIIDATGNQIRLGDTYATVNTDGTFTFTGLWATNSATNPTAFQYRLHIDYPKRSTSKGRETWDSGWFDLTATSDIADVTQTQYVPPTWMTGATTTLQGYVDDAEAARTGAEAARDAAVDISNIDTSDGVMEAVDADAESAFRQQQDARLSATYVPRSNETPTKALYLGPLDPDNGTTIAAIVDGSTTTPNTGANYSEPVVYIERHTNNSVVAQSSDWGNAYRQAAQLIEVVTYPDEVNEVNGLAIRLTDTSKLPITGAGLVGISALAQSDPALPGDRARDMFGANFACVQNSGVAAINMVGIEVDLVPRIPIQYTARPSDPSAPAGEINNWTGYMAQSAGTYPSNTAFLASTSDGTPGNTTPGWYRGFLGECDFLDAAAFFRNTKNAATARGLYVETTFGGATGRVIEAFVGGTELFRVDGDTSNPVWVRRDGALKNMSDFLLQDSSSLTGGQVFNFGKLAMIGDTDVVRIKSKGSAGGYVIYGAADTSGTNGEIRFQDNSVNANNRAVISTAAPGSLETTLLLSYHNGTAIQPLSRVTVGAADSGGTGFRALRIPN